MLDLSIIIAHTFEGRLLRQTLRSIRRAAPRLRYEILVVDNNPEAGLGDVVRREFPDVRYFVSPANNGFGFAMNQGIRAARGKYVLIFNPDIVVRGGALETLFTFMETNPDVGIVGPQLVNPDGTLQYNCNRYHTPLIPVLRRTPLGNMRFGKRMIDAFLMRDTPHDAVMNVDWLMGSALFTRATALADVGAFDEAFFMYFEDTDLCRRFWEKKWRVVYNPNARMIHYHRRASKDGTLLAQLFSRLTHAHIRSAYTYFAKYARKENPRELFEQSHADATGAVSPGGDVADAGF